MNIVELFSALTQRRIEEYVAAKQEEHLLLDFKTVSRDDLSASDDRRNFAVALSGFANSSGGLVIWGVVAKKDRGDGPDCACGVQEISDLAMFMSRLNEFTGAFVRPIVDGVQHRSIETGPNRGFAVTLIPESDNGPHMALAREGRYYKRSGSSFYPMEHFDIEDMFGKRRKPHLDIEFSVVPRGSIRSGGTVEHKNAIGIFVRNSGRASARNIFARIMLSRPYWVSDSGPEADGRGGLTRLSGDGAGQVSLGGNPQLVVHPGMRQGLLAVAFKYDVKQPELPDLEVTIELAADDLPLRSSSHRLTWQSIYEAVKNAT